MKRIVLKIENVSKQYRLGIIGTGTISHDLNRWFSKILKKEDPYLKIGQVNDRKSTNGSYVWALNNINLEIREGDILGVIGKNGAGKSTLLKILSQVTNPTIGSIKAKGKLASLLEVGTGFHQELTGKENIFLNGAILGMSKNEINRKLDQIIDFSGIGSYIDTPVKRYSSGMMVRLGFAVAAHLEPDILIVDEVLAVGDAEFQNKCIGKIKDISSQGRTVLFVSHNMTSLKRLCNRGVLLENGKVIYDGLINEAIKKYNKNHINDESISSIKIEDIIEKPIQFSLIKIIDSKNNKSKNIFEFIEDIKLEITYTVRKNYNDFYTAILLYNYNGDLIMVSADNDSTQEGLLNSGLGQKKLSVIIPKELLNLGKYYLSFSVRRISDDRDKHKIDNCLVFEVIDTISYRSMKNFYRKEAMIAPDILWKSIK